MVTIIELLLFIIAYLHHRILLFSLQSIYNYLPKLVKMFFKLMLICGLCSLFHAAFSAAQYRSYLRVSEQKFTGSLPMDIMIQAFVSLLVTLYSVVSIYCNFKVIFANDDFANKSYGHMFSTPPSLVTFNHRGRILTSKQS